MDAWNQGIGIYLSNSVIITAGATVLSTFVSCLAAYPLARLNFRSKKLWIYVILGGLMLAPQSSVISLFKVVKIAGLYDTRTSLILIDAAFRIPFAAFSKPIIASCAIVSFRAVWNELMYGEILKRLKEYISK